MVTTSSANFSYWNDTNPDHIKGDLVSARFLDGSDGNGIYHEDHIPPAETNSSGILYEQDFSIKPTTANTYYLRVVKVNAGRHIQQHPRHIRRSDQGYCNEHDTQAGRLRLGDKRGGASGAERQHAS